MMSGHNESWFVTSMGGSWHVDQPALWCLAHAHESFLAPARDRLLTLTPDDADRIIRVVVRRCGLNLLEVTPQRVTVHFWGQDGQADLRPFFKQHGLTRPEVEVFLMDRKREVAHVCPGSSFLYGEEEVEGFPWAAYLSQWQQRLVIGPEDWSAAPASVTNFRWDGIEEERIPWAVLKQAWARECPSLCQNCDLDLFLFRIWFVWSKLDALTRACFRCHRQFRDESLHVLSWMVQHLDCALWPTSHHQLHEPGVLRNALEQAAL